MVYHIIEDRDILVTGGAVEAATSLPAGAPVVRPGTVGKTIAGGRLQSVGPGDVAVIPPHTPHGFLEIQTLRIVYALVRIDGHQVLETQ